MKKTNIATLLIIGFLFLGSSFNVGAQGGKRARVTGIPDGTCLYLHSRPVTGNVDVLDCVPKGEEVLLRSVDENTGWTEGCWRDVCGYISYPHLTVVDEPASAPSPTPRSQEAASGQAPSPSNRVDGGICLGGIFLVVLVVVAVFALGGGRSGHTGQSSAPEWDGPDYSPNRCRECGTEYDREHTSIDGDRRCPNCDEVESHDYGA